jgi:hypothetical protein
LLTHKSRRPSTRPPRASLPSTDSRLYLVARLVFVSLMGWVEIASGFNFQRSLEGKLIDGLFFSLFLPFHEFPQCYLL